VQARIGLVLINEIELRDRLIADLKAQLPEAHNAAAE